MESQSLCIGLTIAAFALLFYTYIGYPFVLWALTRLTRSKADWTAEPREWPTVSVVISAYNEEAVIADRVENLLALDYPSDRIEILVGSDGSADRTAEILTSYPQVRLLSFAERRGKASVLNDLVAAACGDIVVLTDANTFFRRDAVRRLVHALIRRPYGSVAVGQLELRSAAGRGNLDGSYWRFETWIKTLESHVGGLLGANGAIYAFRRERYQPLPPQAIVDDFLIPMLMRLRFGDGIFFVPEACAWERSPDDVVDEFRRRVRIGAGDFQALKWTWRLLLPWKGMIALTYFSHKVLRWLGPWFMLVGLVGNLVLIGRPLFAVLLIGQLVFYGLALGGRLFRSLPAVGRVASAARYFVVLNAGLFCGLLRLVSGAAQPTWSAAPRKTLDAEGG